MPTGGGSAGGPSRWPKPSARVRELIRRGAQLALSVPPEWLDELDTATLAASTKIVSEDPVLAAGLRRLNRSNLVHWASANVRAPGEPVAPNLGEETLSLARDFVRRGVGEVALDAYRTGQNAAWSRWMSIAFELTSDVGELRELLDVSSRSIADFIDATSRATAEWIEAERAGLLRGTHAERREVVALVLDGAPVAPANASRRLGYRLDRVHRAAVIWSDEREPKLAELEAIAEGFALAASTASPLVVVATGGTLWVWADATNALDVADVGRMLRARGSLRIAIGSVGEGVDGFRRSHFDALTAQRLVARVGSDERVVQFDDVRLVSLATHDFDGAEDFVKHTLGRLEAEGAEVRATLLAFLREGCNASRAAKRIHTHRNTLLRRLARAEELLPRPLAEHRIDVAVALEIVRWRAG